MESDDVRSIGELARESGLSVSALRFYDGAGVLTPASVDPQTGYRRYAPEQVREARLVARLRRVGMPLADIRRVLACRTDPLRAGRVLDAHLRRLEDGLTDARRELSSIRSLLDEEHTMPSAPTPTRLTVAEPDLAAALDAVRFAVSTNPDLPALAGIRFELRADALWLVATDRYRLAVATAPAYDVDGPDVAATVPTALADELRGLLSGGEVKLQLGDGRLVAQAGGREVGGACVEEEFPDYRRLLQGRVGQRIGVDVPVVREAVATAPGESLVREQDGARYDVVVLTVDPDGLLTVGGESSADGLRVAVNRDFLLEALDAIASDQLVLELDEPARPLAMRVPGAEHPSSLLMPTRLS